ncbi:hypothetical protein, partial [Pedobacter sp. ASV28]|uniref:hypothetical protein n=1 Tax=Pedobacter sp. ASV28 TaxID=2795123 RepID=UPI001E38349E
MSTLRLPIWAFWVCPWSLAVGGVESKKPRPFLEGAFRYRHRPTLPRVTAVPSAQAGLTSL